MKKVCVIGLGYIGLPTATILADNGYDVVGCDVNNRVVESLNCGKVIITEPDLDEIVLRVVKNGKLRACSEAIVADVYVIAVPTPFMEEKKPDLRYVFSAVSGIINLLAESNLVVLESTSPVGTTEAIAELIYERRPELVDKLSIAYCPERVLPGKILRELVENDRIVGGIDEESATAACEFYKTFVKGAVIPTSARTAEMCKLTENAYRDVNIAFANELSIICDEIAIDVRKLIKLANHHPRVNILSPGPGVGGHCIAVDPWFIVDKSPKSSRLIKTARQINDAKPEYIARKIAEACQQVNNPVIACLGLAFKADVDDYRESPSLDVVKLLSIYSPNARIIASDPYISKLPESLVGLKNVAFMPGFVELCQIASHIVVLTDHSVYKKIGRDLLEGKVIIDTRGIFER
ncbi:MAG: UDP-N-acetyl-D-mannosamine dehydrogenase [Negativicutes bacterium]|jgi:UDP-N-acetyl-D-mannosaminuronic acid dehydrogenase